jgi:hypothetical protein
MSYPPQLVPIDAFEYPCLNPTSKKISKNEATQGYFCRRRGINKGNQVQGALRCLQQFLMWHLLIKFEILRAEKPIFLG